MTRLVATGQVETVPVTLSRTMVAWVRALVTGPETVLKMMRPFPLLVIDTGEVGTLVRANIATLTRGKVWCTELVLTMGSLSLVVAVSGTRAPTLLILTGTRVIGLPLRHEVTVPMLAMNLAFVGIPLMTMAGVLTIVAARISLLGLSLRGLMTRIELKLLTVR